MKLKLYYLFFVFILLSSLIYAAPPFIEQQNFEGGIRIFIPTSQYYQVNQPGEINFHVYNSTNFQLDNTTTQCNLHVYMINGTHFDGYDLPYRYGDFYFDLPETIYSKKGIYYYRVYCNSSTEAGSEGFFFEINNNGYPIFYNPILALIPLFSAIIMILFLAYLVAMLTSKHEFLKYFLIMIIFTICLWCSYYALTIVEIMHYQNINTVMTINWIWWVLMSTMPLYILFYWGYTKFIKPLQKNKKKTKPVFRK